MIAVLTGVALVANVMPVKSHVFILDSYRVGAYPNDYVGSGWLCQAYVTLPAASAVNLLTAEAYAASHEPDFTFRTPWIDFPAGPLAFDLDTSFATVGDFLDDYIYDVSDPSKLDLPFGHMLLKFKGLLRVALEDSNTLDPGLPAWVEFGTLGQDGYGTRVIDRIYRVPNASDTPFFHENAIILALGLFPIEITYFNRYDPTDVTHMKYAGVELYSLHGDGLPWPGGANLIHPVFGQSTIMPPRVIYQPEDIMPLMPGDFDANSTIDLIDVGWFQTCYTGPGSDGGFNLDLGCEALDFDKDRDIDGEDFAQLHALVPRGEQ